MESTDWLEVLFLSRRTSCDEQILNRKQVKWFVCKHALTVFLHPMFICMNEHIKRIGHGRLWLHILCVYKHRTVQKINNSFGWLQQNVNTNQRNARDTKRFKERLRTRWLWLNTGCLTGWAVPRVYYIGNGFIHEKRIKLGLFRLKTKKFHFDPQHKANYR